MTKSFADLGLLPELVAALDASGITTPFPIQALTIADALAGRDVCGKAKTGSGKTLAFGLPVLQSDPTPGRRPSGLILVPTRELARQVSEVLDPLAAVLGRRLGLCYGGTGLDAQIKTLQHGVDVVVATPGRLIDLVQRGDVDLSDISIVVLDEADRMADMGFLPQVEWLLRHLEGPHQTMLFSATLDGDVDHLIRDQLRDPVRYEVASETTTVNAMEHRFLLVHEMDKVKVAAALCRGSGRVMIFARTKRAVDRLVTDLAREGLVVRPIHGDLRQAIRERTLRDFSEGRLAVLVATDVAARGIHVDGVDMVLHWDPPEDSKAYLHRSGRTARAGHEGMVVTLVLWNQQSDIERVLRRLGISQPVVQVFSNDPRLADLAAWDPSALSVA